MRPRLVPTLLALAFTLVLARCGPPPSADADGGDRADAGASDGSAASDGGPGDAGADAGVDGGASDAGTDGGSGADGGVDGGTGGGCGDGIIQSGEACDDGNSVAGDGCSATCDRIEQSWACPTPGQACVSTVVCGDGRLGGAETCDDGNTRAGDGCSATCGLETGWACPAAGAPCEAAACGDGWVAGAEACDDGGQEDGDGCSAACELEPGWACPPGQACHETVCGDGVLEGSEGCDDGNQVVGDGCGPFCQVEPDCAGGPCVSACGDGMILSGDAEACDDGNTRAGDGCSPDCQVEAGYACDLATSTLPDVLDVPVTFRDFIALPAGGATKHPDFESYSGSGTPDLVEADLSPDGKPVPTGCCDGDPANDPPDRPDGTPFCSCPSGRQLTSPDTFAQWYADVPGVNISVVTALSLDLDPATETYAFRSASLFPVDDGGWVTAGQETTSNATDGAQHDFGFTSEVRTWFEYRGDESLDFSGDDDVWVFINGRLALDLGGLHSKKSGTVTLDAATAADLGLEVGKVYEVALFHAERHTNASNFNLTLGGFVKRTTTCAAICGDGILAGRERCDDGVNDGRYGSCTADCLRGPYCGDGVVQADHEACDDGVNLTPYGGDAPACAPGCVWSAYCGDGNVDSLFGEACDDGVNAGGYGGCEADCTLGPRCGDGHVDDGEDCDDGNLVGGDQCSPTCRWEIIP